MAGYSEEFTLKQCWDQIVHPGSKNHYCCWYSKCTSCCAVANTSCSSWCSVFLQHRIKTPQWSLPAGEKNIFYFPIMIKNRLAYMDEFTIIGLITTVRASAPRVFNVLETWVEKQQEIMLQSLEYFLEMKIFSVKRIADCAYAGI